MEILTGVILLVVGLIACFFGKRYFRVIMAIQGFAVGYYVVSRLLVDQSDVIQIVAGLVAGLIVGYLFWVLYKFAYMIFGLLLGVLLGTVIGYAFNLDSTIYLIILIVLGILGAILGIALADLMIRLSTAFGGSAQAVSGVAHLSVAAGIALPLADPRLGGANTDSTAGIVTLIIVIALGVIGFMFQTNTQRN